MRAARRATRMLSNRGFGLRLVEPVAAEAANPSVAKNRFGTVRAALLISSANPWARSPWGPVEDHQQCAEDHQDACRDEEIKADAWLCDLGVRTASPKRDQRSLA